MSVDTVQQVERLATRLQHLESAFSELQIAEAEIRKNVQESLAGDTGAALDSLRNMAQLLIKADFKTAAQSCPQMSTVLIDLERSWQKCKSSAERCLDDVFSFSLKIVDFHNVDIDGWQKQADQLPQRLQNELEETQKAINSTKPQLQEFCKAQKDREGIRPGLEQKLQDAKQKYESARVITGFQITWGPVTLMALDAKVQARTHDLQSFDNEFNMGRQKIVFAQQRLYHFSSHLGQVSVSKERLAGLTPRCSSLLDRCKTLMDQVQSTKKEVAKTKSLRFLVWQLASQCLKLAEVSDFEVSKSTLAMFLLLIVDAALNDRTLSLSLAGIIQQLTDHDGSTGSFRDVKTDDHPDGLLSDVRKKLEQVQGGSSDHHS